MKLSRGSSFLALLFLATIAVIAHADSSKPAQVTIKFDIYGGDNGFSATIYVQEVTTGATTKYAYPSHSPPIVVYIPVAGTYVFWATLVEAPDDYHFGATGIQAGSGKKGTGLIAYDIKPGASYEVYIGDRAAQLPVSGKPVTVPWRRAK